MKTNSKEMVAHATTLRHPSRQFQIHNMADTYQQKVVVDKIPSSEPFCCIGCQYKAKVINVTFLEYNLNGNGHLQIHTQFTLQVVTNADIE